MKSPYFTQNSIQDQSQEFLRDFRHPNRCININLLEGRTALLILDMQRYFLDPTSHAFIPSAPAIIPGLIRLIKSFIRSERPVVLTQHINTEANAGMLNVWWSDVIKESSSLSGIVPELKTKPVKIIIKPQYDAFYNTELDKYLKGMGTEQVIICGVMTHLCCETTARSSFVHGYNVVFPVDGSATYDIEFHRATLRNLSHGFASLTSINELCELLD
jgi:bifunctional isochorismate lyase / aryl carrier protein